ncbi:MAG: helix-turn-helix domain-containing protein [Chloroflexi bacterium]|nr:helix-turn-helix domain-containing protein [Chloroflexota bacterium]
MDEASDLGRLLRRLRTRAFLTQEVLAERAGVSVATIKALEEGRRRRPYPDTVLALANALGLSDAERASLLAVMPAYDRDLGRPRPEAEAVADFATTDQEDARRMTSYSELASPLTPLLGREADLAATTQLLRRGARLLTLTGPGGVGKTRLALQLTADTRALFADGVTFVSLASLADAKLVLPTVAQALGIRATGDQPLGQLLERAIRDRHLLLVLDNCEHVLAGVSEVTALLERSPHLAVLATSRAPLRVRGEQEYPVAPLALPAFGDAVSLEDARKSPAVVLFADRARAASPSFALSPANVSVVADICTRLDGLPLALELAAPRLKLLPPTALLTRLHHGLPLLTGGGRDTPARHQTLRTTMAWSYSLLDAPERTLFRRLSVFSGGCTLEAAESVATAPAGAHLEVLDGLGSLVDKSLLQMREDAGEPRFIMLETIREFAQEELRACGEEVATREAHTRQVVEYVQAMRPRLSGPDQVRAMALLAAEQGNLRAALRYLLDSDQLEAFGHLLRLLAHFWWVRGQMAEARRWANEVLTRVTPSALVQARAAYVAGTAAVEQGDEDAFVLLEQARELARGAGDCRLEARCLIMQGYLAPVQGDLEGGLERLKRAQHLLKEQGESGVGVLLVALSTLLTSAGQLDAAEGYAEEYRALAETRGDLLGIARARDCLVIIALLRRDFDRLIRFVNESLASCLTLGQPQLIMYGLLGLAVAAEGTEPVRSARLFAAAARLQETAGVAIWPSRRTLYEPAVHRIRAVLGAGAYDAATVEGRALTPEQAVVYALRAAPAAI